ncbi:MAG TPA: aldo/keto reductase [Saprospiraceae bacterium]|nr:aldo/keto reductase [Saprospiraceae bacterium]
MQTTIPRIQLRPDYSISRIIKGGWHLAGGHGDIDPQTAIEDMYAFVRAGITTFDCADIYTGVEELIGHFLATYRDAFRSGELPPVQVHTKYVPDYDALANLTKKDTEKIIDRSLCRLGVERLDLVQFAWWDYQFPGYVDTAVHLSELQQAGKIRYLGITNFDAAHIQEMVAAGVSFVSNQTQYSVLDHRPEADSNALMAEEDMYYLCYGVLAGGFLTDRYLDQTDPRPPLENRSLTKYRLIIEEFGDYELFQQLLRVLRKIADKHRVDIAAVASRYVLQKARVGGLIIGARNRKHLAKLPQITQFGLDAEDLAMVKAIVDRAAGPAGPVYELERDKTGKHGIIMKYNLNDDNDKR